MKNFVRFAGVCVLFLGFTFLTSCYISPADEDSQTTISLDMVTQAPVGYAGDGYYMKAYLFNVADVEAMISESIIWIEDVETNSCYYYPSQFAAPLNTQAFYLGQALLPGGLVILANLPSGSYQVFLEYVQYAAGDGESAYYAGLTDAFSVSSGSLATVGSILYYAYNEG